jgi:uncharacterized membrane protein
MRVTSPAGLIGLNVACMLVVALSLRVFWVWMLSCSSVPLDPAQLRALWPDEQQYFEAATGLVQLRYLSFREPVFPVVVSVFFALVGASPFTLRLCSALFGAIVVFLTWRVGRTLFREFVGVASAALVAFDVQLVWNSARGLREQLFGAVLLALILVVLESKRPLRLRSLVCIAILSAILPLTRLEGILPVLGVALYLVAANVRRDRGSVQLAFLMISSALVAIFVWFAYCSIALGDPFVTSRVQSSWWYYVEFGKYKNIGMIEYLFGYHSLAQLALMTLHGIVKILTSFVGMIHGWLWVLYVFVLGLFGIGFCRALSYKRGLVLNFCIIFGVLPMAFFFGIEPALPYGWAAADIRLLYPYFPLVYVTLASASGLLYNLISKRLFPKRFRWTSGILGRRVSVQPSVLVLLWIPFSVAGYCTLLLNPVGWGDFGSALMAVWILAICWLAAELNLGTYAESSHGEMGP